MPATPDRLKTMRDVTAMVALDTVDLLAMRVRNLLAPGRRMTIARRYTYENRTPEVAAGLTLDGEVEHRIRDGGAVVSVRLKPGLLAGFGFSVYAGEADTEADAWKRYHAAEKDNDRRDLTMVEISGGLPGDGPARHDQLIIRHWNTHGVCDERVIAFDYETGQHNALTAVRDELREHMANLGDKQPWDNRSMFERVLAVLEANAVVAQEG